MPIGDDDDTPRMGVLRPDLDEIPTKKIGVRKCPVANHENDTLCACICHNHSTIHHMHPCCIPCACGFRVKITPPPREEESDDPVS
jgi:hypothetical protein